MTDPVTGPAPETVEALLHWATRRLQDSEGEREGSPRLAAECLLAHCLGNNRTWLYTWSDQRVDPAQRSVFADMVARRCQGEPVAYLTGEREFWSLPLKVSPHTLIPRPDTETLVEAALALPLSPRARVLDLGTGTGAIALALASERPDWEIWATDRVEEAVNLARENSERLGLPVRVLHSHWFDQLPPGTFDLILSNPPYIDAEDAHLSQGDVRHEPRSALVAGDQGLADLQLLIQQSGPRLNDGGWLALEHGWQQAEKVREAMHGHGYSNVATHRDLGGNERITLGQLSTSATDTPDPGAGDRTHER